MVNVKEIIKYLDEKYPEELRAVWDSTDGFLQGDSGSNVNTIGVGLEINKDFVEGEFDLLVLHHPPKFGKDKIVTNPFYAKLKEELPIYTLHSRIDVSGDLNKSIATVFFEKFIVDKVLDDGTVIISLEEEENLSEIVESLKLKLDISKLKVIEKNNYVKKIAIHGGEGFNQHHVEKAVNEGIDLYLAGDLNHHLAEFASFYNVTFIDINHISEQLGMRDVCKNLQKKFPDCVFKYINTRPYWVLK